MRLATEKAQAAAEAFSKMAALLRTHGSDPELERWESEGGAL